MATKTTRSAKTSKTSSSKKELPSDVKRICLPSWVIELELGDVIMKTDGSALLHNVNFKEYDKYGLVLWAPGVVEEKVTYSNKKVQIEEYVELRLFGVDTGADITLETFKLTATLAKKCKKASVEEARGFIDTMSKKRIMVARQELDAATTNMYYATERIGNLHNLRVKYGLSRDEKLGI